MSIPLVSLNSIVLLNVSDVLSRNSQSNIGILLGRFDVDKFIIRNSFELLLNDNQSIDFDYLTKKLKQYSQTYPDDYIVGLYQIDIGKNYIDDLLQWLLNFQIQDNKELITVVFDKSLKGIEAYYQNRLIKSIIETSETESITTLTIDKHKNYATKNKKQESISITQHNETLSITLNKLYERITKILEYFENNQDLDFNTRIELDKLLVKLVNNFQFKQPINNESKLLKLQLTQLSLITEQLLVSERVKLQISKSITSGDLPNN
ncbi:unnamed protein product [Candida verbasci]|uniref:JAB1/MPN/MOV34 metalloenzyme domain-containing protein n=1 Tax=Candida verbasci TaxID=1227364 RepID=A0A9W4TR83_9ASCO|nr:unnamed protein product [Candida verbasci]